jgi:molybdopterin synthase catalytic subunit
MKISIRSFASYRDAIGVRQVILEVSEGTTAADVWDGLVSRYPKLAVLPRPRAYAVNDAYVDANTTLQDRDELVLIPPVSGGEPIALTHDPIDIPALIRAVQHPKAGAVALFLGTVRDNARGRPVEYLEYEAYETMALRELTRGAEEASARWPVLRIGIIHRLGHLEIGEVSVAVAVAAPHRREAFDAARFAIDTLKQTVPIWKKEVWEGGAAWVGSDVIPPQD